MFWNYILPFSSVQFSSVAQSCPTLCDPMNHSTPGLLSITNSQSSPKLMSIESVMPSNHFILCCSLLLPSVFPRIRVYFKWVSSLHQITKVLEFQLQHQSFQWIFRTDFLEDGLVGSPSCPGDSQESAPTPQFKSINSSALSFLYSLTLTSIRDHWKNHSLNKTDLSWQSNVSPF